MTTCSNVGALGLRMLIQGRSTPVFWRKTPGRDRFEA
jgi:hypothetical protein